MAHSLVVFFSGLFPVPQLRRDFEDAPRLFSEQAFARRQRGTFFLGRQGWECAALLSCAGGCRKRGARVKEKEMSAQAIFDILSSSSREDWINLEEQNLFVYKQDVHLRIQKRSLEYSEKFEGEEWAVRHPCPDAYKVYYDIYYGASLIMTKTLVDVDGGRAILPMPRIRTTEIPHDDYQFAKIVSLDSLDEYITRSKLTVAD